MTTARGRGLGLKCLIASTFTALCLANAAPASAQYFGQNKVQYDHFDFQVLKTEHFDIYFYPQEKDVAAEVGRMAERWHARLSKILQHTLSGRQPVILYASHPDFEQTNVVEDMIGEGTGGVTEGAKRRVTLPMAATLGETDHVLGHELVHAFQYDILGQGSEGLPLWFIEGMAEYLSLGPRDVQTSMWLRDAALQEKLPAIKDLDNPRYFPYRFGHAFWAYMGGRFGDNITGTILQGIAAESAGGHARGPYLEMIEAATERTIPELSEEWQKAVVKSYSTLGTPEQGDAGQMIGKPSTTSDINVSPSISPDGSRVAFLSSRERLSIDLYVADAASGKVLQTLIKTAGDPHFDSLQFLQSAGAWDPTGHTLAIAAIRKGRPVLALVDADKGGVKKEIPFPDLGEIFQPTWSPDGKTVAFSAQTGGVTDLFLYDFAAGTTTRLTQDAFCDLQPTWSQDGKQLAFVTDRFSSDISSLSFHGYGLATMTVADKNITKVETGLPGNAINPQWSGDGALYFIGDAGGRQDVYRTTIATHEVSRITEAATGVAGITPLSPALSVSATSGRAAVSVFRNGGYDVYAIPLASAATAPPAAATIDIAQLPPTRQTSLVAQSLADAATGLPQANATPEMAKYSPKMSLVGFGQSVGVSTGGGFGSYVGGGIALLFSDTLGEHLLNTSLNINGGVKDIGAAVSYINRVHRWNWGTFVQRAPYVTGFENAQLGIQNGQQVIVSQLERFREADNEVGGLTSYPLSRSSRLELSLSERFITFNDEVRTQIFDAVSGQLLSDTKTNVNTSDPLLMTQFSAAFVQDTSVSGATSPIRGGRFRLEGTPSFGDLKMTTVTADYRRYIMPVRPITFAGRLLHVARYGSGGEDGRLTPLFIGYSTLVRGWDVGTFRTSECTVTADSSCVEFDRLLGSRILVANGEVRAPLVGLFRHNLDYGALPIEVFAFGDAGVAWSKGDKPSFAGGSRDWVGSVGGGARVNLLGFAIGEFNLVHPLNRPQRDWIFVFNLRPGF